MRFLCVFATVVMAAATNLFAATESTPLGGATFVPLDTWTYPALTRLAAMGYIPDQNTAVRPWTRAECARQVAEAEHFIGLTGATPKAQEALRLLKDLEAEFPPETRAIDKKLVLESVYTGFTGISGQPLRDSYHFGQTITDNFGRPFGHGLNNETGFSAYGSYGHFFAAVRGEFEYAPGAPAQNTATRSFISSADSNPLQPPSLIPSTNRFTLLDTYIGGQLGFESVSFGKQSFWWGPGEASAYAFSNNAAPFYTLNLSQTRAFVLPGVLRYLGPVHTQFLFGELQGHHWPRRPLMNAQKVSFEISRDLELGFTRSAFWGGVGHPLTLGTLGASLLSGASTGTTFAYGDRTDPGDRHSGFDFRYRIPGLRNYLTLYSDSYADDDPSPLGNPSRGAWAPGIYVSRLPHFEHLDLRLETYSTSLYAGDQGGQFIYFNNQYHDAYTNSGNLLGSWIGRDARAYVASAGYWFSARRRITGQYRQVKDSATFLPGGGTQTDVSLNGNWTFGRNWMTNVSVQGERYNIPLLGAPQHDTAASFTLTYFPHLELQR